MYIYTYLYIQTHIHTLTMYHISQHHHTHTHLPLSLYICIHMYIGTYMRTYRHTHTYIYTHTYTSLCSKVSGSKNTELSVSILSASPLKGGFWSWPQKNSLHCCSTSQAGKKCRSTGGSSSNRNSNSKRATPTEH